MSARSYYLQKVPLIHRIYCAVSIVSVPLGIGFVVAGALIFINTEGQGISTAAGLIVAVGIVLVVAVPVLAFFVFRLKLIVYDKRPHIVKRGTSKHQYFLSTIERSANVYSVNEETTDAPVHGVHVSSKRGIDNPAMADRKPAVTSFAAPETTDRPVSAHQHTGVRFSTTAPPAYTKTTHVYENIHDNKNVAKSNVDAPRNKSSLFPSASKSAEAKRDEASSKF